MGCGPITLRIRKHGIGPGVRVRRAPRRKRSPGCVRRRLLKPLVSAPHLQLATGPLVAPHDAASNRITTRSNSRVAPHRTRRPPTSMVFPSREAAPAGAAERRPHAVRVLLFGFSCGLRTPLVRASGYQRAGWGTLIERTSLDRGFVANCPMTGTFHSRNSEYVTR